MLVGVVLLGFICGFIAGLSRIPGSSTVLLWVITIVYTVILFSIEDREYAGMLITGFALAVLAGMFIGAYLRKYHGYGIGKHRMFSENVEKFLGNKQHKTIAVML